MFALFETLLYLGSFSLHCLARINAERIPLQLGLQLLLAHIGNFDSPGVFELGNKKHLEHTNSKDAGTNTDEEDLCDLQIQQNEKLYNSICGSQ